MTAQVITSTPRPPAVGQPQERPTSRHQQAAQALEKSRDRLEAPFRAGEALHEWVYAPEPGLTPRLPHYPVAAFEPPRPGTSRAADEARRWEELAPSRAKQAEYAALFGSVLAAKHDEAATRLCLGLLLDSFPNGGKEPRESYFATVLHDLRDAGYGPHIVGEACKDLRRGQRFLPTVSEVLGACAKARAAMERNADLAASLLEKSAGCDEALRVAALDPSEWPDAAWLNAAREWRYSGPLANRRWNDRLGPPPNMAGTRFPDHLRSVMSWPSLEQGGCA